MKTVYVDYSGRLQKAQIDTHALRRAPLITHSPSTPSRPTSAEWLARDEAALAGVLSRIIDIVAVRGRGLVALDVDGRRYLDFGSGIAVTNIGHCHPAVVAAIEAQAATLIHTSVVAHTDGQ